MGYDESFFRLKKKDMSKFIKNADKYEDLFSTYGTQIYAHVKLLQPLKWGNGYTCGLEPFDLPVGEYIWVGGERRGHIYAIEDAPKDLKMNLCPVFVSNFDFDEIKRMQHDTEFAIVTPLRDFDKLKGDK